MVEEYQCARMAPCVWKGKTDDKGVTPCEASSLHIGVWCQFQLAIKRDKDERH